MQPDELLPEPKHTKLLKGSLSLSKRLRTDGTVPHVGLERLCRALEPHGVELSDSAAAAESLPTLEIHLREATPPEATIQGSYRLEITPHGIRITSSDDSGVFYALMTLCQWLDLHPAAVDRDRPLELTTIEIDDQPAFLHRGVLLDISRNRVPRLDRLYELIDRLAGLKINQLQLYMEHTFAYARHETVWRDASPFTAAEIRELDRYARERFVELVPNQNSFGHLHRWLRLPEYRHLAECPEGVKHPFGDEIEPFSLCPTDPQAFAWLDDLYGQLLPNFSSRRFNVGLDETFDLGRGRSAAACEERGRATVYLEFVREVHRLVGKHGRKMQLWGDIVLEEPESIERLPKDVTGLIWGYEADHPFPAQTRAFRDSGLPFYVCPGTSSWNSLTGRTTNSLENLRQAAAAGSEHGAEGFLVTDWGDFGHLQPPSVSSLPLAAAADLSWNPEASANRPRLQHAVDRWMISSPSAGLAAIADRLGDVYRLSGATPKNGTVPFFALVFAHEEMTGPRYANLTGAGLQEAERAATDCAEQLAKLQTPSIDGERYRRELIWSAEAAACGARLAALRLSAPEEPVQSLPRTERAELLKRWQSLRERFGPLWLESSRSGGLADSQARLERVAQLLSDPPSGAPLGT